MITMDFPGEQFPGNIPEAIKIITPRTGLVFLMREAIEAITPTPDLLKQEVIP